MLSMFNDCCCRDVVGYVVDDGTRPTGRVLADETA